MARYVFSDLHGNYTIWRKIVAVTQSNDELYCLGDNIDRGPDGFQIYLEQKNMPNVTVFKGNHEDLAAAALPDLLRQNFNTKEVKNWFMNGGDKTWEKMQYYSKNQMIDFINWCNNLRETIMLDSKNKCIFLSHAGFSLNQYQDHLWDRSHFLDPWPDNFAQNVYIIHGHTPVQYLKYTLDKTQKRVMWDTTPTIITYANGHKIDIDLGTIISKRIALFNLDTFEVQYIENNT